MRGLIRRIRNLYYRLRFRLINFDKKKHESKRALTKEREEKFAEFIDEKLNMKNLLHEIKSKTK